MHRALFRVLMSAYDHCWRLCHRVQRVDELVSLSFETWDGPPRLIGGRSYIRPGDRIGVLHFNRECLRRRAGASGTRMAFRFVRLLFVSMHHIAERMERGAPELAPVRVLYGITWFPPHGQRLGFTVERMPDGLRSRLLRLHFRLFLHAFFPTLAGTADDVHPHAFWLTREQLLKNFRSAAAHERVRKAVRQ